MTSRTTKTTTSVEPEFPGWWDWDSDGDECNGTFVRAGRGFTANGERAFVVLDVGGTERTVWLHHKVLAAIFAREVQRRPDKRIAAGERIELQRLGERTGGNGRDYTNYRGEFPDGPQPTQADIFGPPPELADQQAEPSPAPSTSEGDSENGDDIPF